MPLEEPDGSGGRVPGRAPNTIRTARSRTSGEPPRSRHAPHSLQEWGLRETRRGSANMSAQWGRETFAHGIAE